MTAVKGLLPGVPPLETPFYVQAITEMDLTASERDIALQLATRGYAVMDFPDADIIERIQRIKDNLSPRFDVDFDDPDAVKNTGDLRIQDAWKFDENVKAIATNETVLDLLSKLYGRRAFPFQTLNFPVGTQQHFHSDAVHFSSIPERFMCGVWLAMEDIHPDSGPLVYCPQSHKWPILNNAMMGRPGWNNRSHSAQSPYEAVWDATVRATDSATETFLAKKGQALIWAANLLHGGSGQNDRRLTRWSQVTHYYFADCIYYTPAFSDEALGRLDLRCITNIASGEIEENTFLGESVTSLLRPVPPERQSWISRLSGRKAAAPEGLPEDFNAENYYRLNPDVAAAGEDARSHYLKHGIAEGRRYRG